MSDPLWTFRYLSSVSRRGTGGIPPPRVSSDVSYLYFLVPFVDFQVQWRGVWVLGFKVLRSIFIRSLFKGLVLLTCLSRHGRATRLPGPEGDEVVVRHPYPHRRFQSMEESASVGGGSSGSGRPCPGVPGCGGRRVERHGPCDGRSSCGPIPPSWTGVTLPLKRKGVFFTYCYFVLV